MLSVIRFQRFFVVRAGDVFESRATPRFNALIEGEE